MWSGGYTCGREVLAAGCGQVGVGSVSRVWAGGMGRGCEQGVCGQGMWVGVCAEGVARG